MGGDLSKDVGAGDPCDLGHALSGFDGDAGARRWERNQP
jgi:hypothetical protein